MTDNASDDASTPPDGQDVDRLLANLHALASGTPPSMPPAAPDPESPEAILGRLADLVGESKNAGGSAASALSGGGAGGESRPGRSAIVDFGVDLTARARDGAPVFFGRADEIETVLEALCRRRKANPLLLGPPGSGKSALVEAVAARIASGDVPDLLRDQRVIAVSASALVSGGGIVGELEARVEVLLREATGTDVILFFDEVHTLMGAGGREGTGDVASLIKPALARGDVRCIAATTDDEYHRFIQTDPALERRFLPIRLRALTAVETRQILGMLRDADAATPSALLIPDAVLDAIVERMERVLPNRHFPDKAIDLFDQVMAHTRLRALSAVTLATVDAVAERMAGIPANPSRRLERLATSLKDGGWCGPEDIEALTERLSITLRGLDLHPDRPNVVVNLAAPSLERVRGFAGQLALALFGDARRVLEIDGGALASEISLTALLGASAGYVGYGDRHQLAVLADQPCHVVLIHAMEEAHPAVNELLMKAIQSGWVTDARSRRIAFSEAVVLRWLNLDDPERPVMGFIRDSRVSPSVRGSADPLGWRVDLTIALSAEDPVGHALDSLAQRWLESQGIRLTWSPSVRNWVAAGSRESGDVAAFVDLKLAGPLWRLLQDARATGESRLAVDVREGVLHIG